MTAYFGISALGTVAQTPPRNGRPTTNQNIALPPPKHIAGIAIASIGTGFVLSFLYFLAMQRYISYLDDCFHPKCYFLYH